MRLDEDRGDSLRCSTGVDMDDCWTWVVGRWEVVSCPFVLCNRPIWVKLFRSVARDMVVCPLTMVCVPWLGVGARCVSGSVLIGGPLLIINTGPSLEALIGGVVVMVRIFLSAGSPICSGLIRCLYMLDGLETVEMTGVEEWLFGTVDAVKMRREEVDEPSIVAIGLWHCILLHQEKLFLILTMKFWTVAVIVHADADGQCVRYSSCLGWIGWEKISLFPLLAFFLDDCLQILWPTYWEV